MEIEYIIVIIVLLIIILFNTYRISCLEERINNDKRIIEGLDETNLSTEALKNISSVYDGEQLIISNLKVTGNLDVVGNSTIGGNSTVTGNSTINGTSTLKNANINGKMTASSAKIGSYEIRNDRIGIPGRADIHIDPNKWCYLRPYDGGGYAPNVGFASSELWTDNGQINNSSPLYRGNEVKLQHTSGTWTNNMGWPWVHVAQNGNIIKWTNGANFKLV